MQALKAELQNHTWLYIAVDKPYEDQSNPFTEAYERLKHAGNKGINRENDPKYLDLDPLKATIQAPLIVKTVSDSFITLIKRKVEYVYYQNPHLHILMITYQIIFGIKTVYHKLENDEQNIVWNGRRSGLWLLTAVWITRLNTFLERYCNHVILAERCFLNECWFAPRQALYIRENGPATLWQPAFDWFNHSPPRQDYLPTSPQIDNLSIDTQLLITGTIGKHYGALDALATLAPLAATCNLTLAYYGFSPDRSFARHLQQIAMQNAFVTEVDIDTQKPFAVMQARIRNAQLVYMPYRISPATRNRIPVKMLECIWHRTPYFITENSAWQARARLAQLSERLS